jgi:hypothetical protein
MPRVDRSTAQVSERREVLLHLSREEKNLQKIRESTGLRNVLGMLTQGSRFSRTAGSAFTLGHFLVAPTALAILIMGTGN